MSHCPHCWHDTGTALLSDPPRYGQVCYHCGAGRTISRQLDLEGHGFHHPDRRTGKLNPPVFLTGHKEQ